MRISMACLLVAAAMLFAGPNVLRACPLCSEAIANSNSGSDEDEIDNFPAAMNQSIYLMLAVPYTALGVVGFCIYRGVRQNEIVRDALEASRAPTETD